MVEQEHNCYYVDFKDSRKTRLCNVPRHVLVIIPSNGEDRNVEVRLNVLVEFNGKTLHGEWYCDKSLPTITQYFKQETLPKISKIMGWSTNKIWIYTSCQEDNCFDTRERYYIGKPWVEPKGCKPPNISS